MKNKSLIILSGGLDSTVCAYLAKNESKYMEAITFDYNQRHKIELKKAKKIAKLLKINHTIIKIPTGIFQNSSLVDKNISVKKNKISTKTIPNTYVPGRNILFLSFATSFAESKNLNRIYIGVNSLDYSGYPDCRPEFIQSFQRAISIGTKSGVNKGEIQIITPLISLGKKEIVELGLKLKVPFGLTHSCYDPIGEKPCGKCESCLLRKKGFEEAGIKDE